MEINPPEVSLANVVGWEQHSTRGGSMAARYYGSKALWQHGRQHGREHRSSTIRRQKRPPMQYRTVRTVSSPRRRCSRLPAGAWVSLGASIEYRIVLIPHGTGQGRVARNTGRSGRGKRTPPRFTNHFTFGGMATRGSRDWDGI